MPKKGSHNPRPPISDPSDPHGWHAVTEAFLEWMGVQNYSPKTVDNRRTYLRYFVQWAVERGLIIRSRSPRPSWSAISATCSTIANATACR